MNRPRRLARTRVGITGLGVAAWALAGCMAPQAPAAPPSHPVGADGSIAVQARPLTLDPRDARRSVLGALVYAGGLELTSGDTTRLHGLSGLDIAEDGVSFVSNTDEGDLVTGRLVLDGAGRLVGLEGVKLQPLHDERGQPLQGKAEGDAEDITLLPGRGMAVSFERDHRVLEYARPNSPGRLAWRAAGNDELGFHLNLNGGVEALTAAPQTGALFVGSEDGDIRAIGDGRIAAERLSPKPPVGFKLTGLDTLSGEDWIAVYRAYDPIFGARAVIASLPQPRCIRAPCVAPHGLVELAHLQRPLSVDNFEGIAAVPLDGGGWRLYIVSDDNFSASERTLLMAFDWRPAGSHSPAG